MQREDQVDPPRDSRGNAKITCSLSLELRHNRSKTSGDAKTCWISAQKELILFESNLEEESLGWWKKTEYGQKLNGDGQSQTEWSTESRHADVWKHFDQIADIDSGRPRIFCKPVLLCLITFSTKRTGQAP